MRLTLRDRDYYRRLAMNTAALPNDATAQGRGLAAELRLQVGGADNAPTVYGRILVDTATALAGHATPDMTAAQLVDHLLAAGLELTRTEWESSHD